MNLKAKKRNIRRVIGIKNLNIFHVSSKLQRIDEKEKRLLKKEQCLPTSNSAHDRDPNLPNKTFMDLNADTASIGVTELHIEIGASNPLLLDKSSFFDMNNPAEEALIEALLIQDMDPMYNLSGDIVPIDSLNINIDQIEHLSNNTNPTNNLSNDGIEIRSILQEPHLELLPYETQVQRIAHELPSELLLY